MVGLGIVIQTVQLRNSESETVQWCNSAIVHNINIQTEHQSVHSIHYDRYLQCTYIT